MFLISMIAAALSAEPAATASVASFSSERESHLAALHTAREQVDLDGPIGQCTVAKTSYRSAQAEIAMIDAELALPANLALGTLETDHRAKLVALKAVETKRLAAAQALASKSGLTLKSDRDKIAAIDSAIARINAQKETEQAASGLPDWRRVSRTGSEGLGVSASAGTGLNPNMMNGIGGLIGSRGTELMTLDDVYGDRSAVIQRHIEPPPLPAEFSACFPNEVGTSS